MKGIGVMMRNKILALAAMMVFGFSAVAYAVTDTDAFAEPSPKAVCSTTEKALQSNHQLFANGGHDGSYLHLAVMRTAAAGNR